MQAVGDDARTARIDDDDEPVCHVVTPGALSRPVSRADGDPDPIVVVDRDGRTKMWNAAADQFADLAANSMRNAEWIARTGLYASDRTTPITPDDLPIARALRGEEIDIDLFLKNKHKPEGAWLRTSVRPLRDERGGIAGAVGVYRDITKERLAHEQLMISDRMASIGLMAAGVGHEINNPLTTIIGLASLLLDTSVPTAEQERHEDLHMINQEARRARDIAHEHEHRHDAQRPLGRHVVGERGQAAPHRGEAT